MDDSFSYIMTVRLPKYVLDILNDLAQELDVSRSAIIRTAIAKEILEKFDLIKNNHEYDKKVLKRWLEVYAKNYI